MVSSHCADISETSVESQENIKLWSLFTVSWVSSWVKFRGLDDVHFCANFCIEFPHGAVSTTTSLAVFNFTSWNPWPRRCCSGPDEWREFGLLCFQCLCLYFGFTTHLRPHARREENFSSTLKTPDIFVVLVNLAEQWLGDRWSRKKLFKLIKFQRQSPKIFT